MTKVEWPYQVMASRPRFGAFIVSFYDECHGLALPRMTAALWFVLAGVLLIGIALASSTIKRLPLTTALIYLGVGYALGPEAGGLLQIGALSHAGLIERLSEIAVIVSLFSAGLKLRVPLGDSRWTSAVRLASLSMVITVSLIAVTGVAWLGLPLGAAILLGAILAPTDPVLASDVQVGDAFDRDRLRFSLTGEAGLNDGTAFPFVMLGLGLLGMHDLGEGARRFIAIDVCWAVAGGLGIGAGVGTMVGRLVVHLRRIHREALGTDDFIAIGLIVLTYGVALLCRTYGFLAVFAAGIALRRMERVHSADRPAESVKEAAKAVALGDEERAAHPQDASAYMAEAVRHMTEHLERLGEVVVVLVVGALLSPATVSTQAAIFALVLFFVIRPLAVVAGLAGGRMTRTEVGLTAWFGIRGIGSIYYLMYAVSHGLPLALSERLVTLTLTTIAISTVLHGLSVTPLMKRHADAKALARGTGGRRV